jgi:Tol biopolymer transport system component
MRIKEIIGIRITGRFAVMTGFLCLFLSLTTGAYPFGKNKIQRESYNWHIIRSVHFDIYYPEGMDELAARSLTIAEEGYQSISNALSHEVSRVIPVIVYPSAIAFQENTIDDSLMGEGVGGFTEPIKGRVVVPFTGDYAEYRHVLTHEIVHAITFDLLGAGSGVSSIYSSYKAPLWIMEGLAEYLSAGYDESADTVMRDIIYNERYADLVNLTRGYVMSGYLFYKEGQSFFYFLVKQYGQQSIARLMREIREQGDFDDALKAVTGKDTKELNQEWIHFFKLIYYPASGGKQFDQDIGVRYTQHPDDYSSYNSSPAVSPDGKRIAYLSNQGLYTHISVMELGKKKAKKVITIVHGETSSLYEGLHLLDNNLTWSSDDKEILFCAQSDGRDALFVVNADNGKVIERYAPPLRSARNPSFSRDGTRVVFVGQNDRTEDIYIYTRPSKLLERITSDPYSERDPLFMPSGDAIIYSTNRTEGGRVDSQQFSLVKRDLASGKTEPLVANGARNIQGEISSDGKTLLYVSDQTGIFNIYKIELDKKKEERLSNVLSGLYSPKLFPDGKRIAFVSYQNLGYDISVKEIPFQDGISQAAGRETLRDDRVFQPSYITPADYFNSVYSPAIGRDYLLAMGAGMYGGGGFALTGIVQASFSDMLGEHRVLATVEYYGYSDQSGANADLSYWYLKYRTDFGIGIFSQRSPYGIISVETINQLIHNIYSDTTGVNRYGVYGVASYPFSRFLRLDITGTSSRYEWEYFRSEPVNANLNTVECALHYDTTVWSFMGPVDGTRAMIQSERAVNLTGQDYSYQSVNVDLRRYFFFFDYYSFAFRAAGGKIFGRDRGSFNYSLGGFDNLRGYSYGEFKGENMYLLGAEFRFITIEGIKFGFPLFFGIGGIGGVLFADVGSAWNGTYSFKKREGGYDGIKSDIGFGFRLALLPAVSLKLDFGWPYTNKRFGEPVMYFSIGIDF